MQDGRVGFGLLGAGLVAPFHARALQASSNARLVAIADTDKDRRDKLAAEFRCASYDCLEDMLENSEVEVVNVLTPNHLHYDAVIQIARAGRHALVEKPPAMSLREVDEMAAAGHSAGVQIGVVLQCRVREAAKAIRAAVLEGRFGKIYHADAYMKWFRAANYYGMDAWRSSQRSGAGVTIQQAFHYIDLLQHIVGPARKVQARMSNLGHPGVNLEDDLLAFVDYASGALGVVQASTALWPGTDIRIEINGQNGTAVMVGERIETWKFRDERAEDDAIRRLGSGAIATGSTGPADFGFQDHQTVIEDMADAIRTGRPPMITLESVRPALEWALAMYLSAKLGSPVELPLRQDQSPW